MDERLGHPAQSGLPAGVVSLFHLLHGNLLRWDLLHLERSNVVLAGGIGQRAHGRELPVELGLHGRRRPRSVYDVEWDLVDIAPVHMGGGRTSGRVVFVCVVLYDDREWDDWKRDPLPRPRMGRIIVVLDWVPFREPSFGVLSFIDVLHGRGRIGKRSFLERCLLVRTCLR